ncbi:hypothetical protein [Paracoccus sp. (in: a-proteobacteria)]|uniref:hypothetical protein n=1 Tax=Paracoccus sp. TaxID=267 RepID=UPI003A889388
MSGSIFREVTIGDCRLLQGDAMALLPMVGSVDHIICDPPYEQSLHDLKNNAKRRMRTDDGPELRGLDFAGIDAIRDDFARLCAGLCKGWFVAFCTIEGVARWADVINPQSMRYKRACIWVKPDLFVPAPKAPAQEVLI